MAAGIRTAIVVAVALIASALGVADAGASRLQVCDDLSVTEVDGEAGLAAAVASANDCPGHQTIRLEPGLYQATANVPITDSLTVLGGLGVVVDATRSLFVVTDVRERVTLDGLEVRVGEAGQLLFSTRSDVTIQNSTITGVGLACNVSRPGAPVQANGGSLTILDSTITTPVCNGVQAYGQAVVTVERSTIVGAASNGLESDHTTTVTDTEIGRNGGHGIRSVRGSGSTGVLRVTDSWIHGNGQDGITHSTAPLIVGSSKIGLDRNGSSSGNQRGISASNSDFSLSSSEVAFNATGLDVTNTVGALVDFSGSTIRNNTTAGLFLGTGRVTASGLRVVDNTTDCTFQFGAWIDDGTNVDSDATCGFVVPNSPPVAVLESATVDEGSDPVELDATLSTDPDGDALTFAWSSNLFLSDFETLDFFDTQDDGVFPVWLDACDAAGCTRADATVTVQNVAPSVRLTGPVATVAGQVIEVEVAIDDPGSLDTHQAVVTWGDEGAAPGPPAPVAVVDGQRFSHTYAGPGDFVVEVVVTDDDGGRAVSELAVAVEPDPRLVATIDLDVSLHGGPSFNESFSLDASFSAPPSGIVTPLQPLVVDPGWPFADAGRCAGLTDDAQGDLPTCAGVLQVGFATSDAATIPIVLDAAGDFLSPTLTGDCAGGVVTIAPGDALTCSIALYRSDVVAAGQVGTETVVELTKRWVGHENLDVPAGKIELATAAGTASVDLSALHPASGGTRCATPDTCSTYVPVPAAGDQVLNVAESIEGAWLTSFEGDCGPDGQIAGAGVFDLRRCTIINTPAAPPGDGVLLIDWVLEWPHNARVPDFVFGEATLQLETVDGVDSTTPQLASPPEDQPDVVCGSLQLEVGVYPLTCTSIIEIAAGALTVAPAANLDNVELLLDDSCDGVTLTISEATPVRCTATVRPVLAPGFVDFVTEAVPSATNEGDPGDGQVVNIEVLLDGPLPAERVFEWVTFRLDGGPVGEVLGPGAPEGLVLVEAGRTTARIQLPILGDEVIEPDVDLEIRVTEGSSGAVASTRATVADDDTPGDLDRTTLALALDVGLACDVPATVIGGVTVTEFVAPVGWVQGRPEVYPCLQIVNRSSVPVAEVSLSGELDELDQLIDLDTPLLPGQSVDIELASFLRIPEVVEMDARLRDGFGTVVDAQPLRVDITAPEYLGGIESWTTAGLDPATACDGRVTYDASGTATSRFGVPEDIETDVWICVSMRNNGNGPLFLHDLQFDPELPDELAPPVPFAVEVPIGETTQRVIGPFPVLLAEEAAGFDVVWRGDAPPADPLAVDRSRIEFVPTGLPQVLLTVDTPLEGDANAPGTMTATLQLIDPVTNAPAPADIAVTLTVEDRTATAGEDFVETTPLVIDFTASGTVPIELPLLGDDIAEADETLAFVITSDDPVATPNSIVTSTIIDDDRLVRPVFSVRLGHTEATACDGALVVDPDNGFAIGELELPAGGYTDMPLFACARYENMGVETQTSHRLVIEGRGADEIPFAIDVVREVGPGESFTRVVGPITDLGDNVDWSWTTFNLGPPVTVMAMTVVTAPEFQGSASLRARPFVEQPDGCEFVDLTESTVVVPWGSGPGSDGFQIWYCIEVRNDGTETIAASELDLGHDTPPVALPGALGAGATRRYLVGPLDDHPDTFELADPRFLEWRGLGPGLTPGFDDEVLADDAATVTVIEDTAGAPLVILRDEIVLEGREGTTLVSIPVVAGLGLLESLPAEAVLQPQSGIVVGTSCDAGIDLIATGVQALTITPFNAAPTVDFLICGDLIDEVDEVIEVQVRRVGPAGDTLARATVTIEDDDAPLVIGSVKDIEVTERDQDLETVSVTIPLLEPAESERFFYLSLGGDATGAVSCAFGADLVVQDLQLGLVPDFSIERGATQIDFDFDVCADRYPELTEDATLFVDNFDTFEPITSIAVRILDEDAYPVLRGVPSTGVEGAASAVFEVVTPAEVPWTYNVSVEPVGDATVGVCGFGVDVAIPLPPLFTIDFTALDVGDEVDKLINSCSDLVTEDDFVIDLVLTALNPLPGEPPQQATSRVTVLDNDQPARLQGVDLSVDEDAGDVQVVFEIDEVGQIATTVFARLVGDSASLDTDVDELQFSQLARAIPAGFEPPLGFTVRIVDDQFEESTEQFDLRLYDAPLGGNEVARATVTILDNDRDDPVFIEPPLFEAVEGFPTSLVFEVDRPATSTADLVVGWTPVTPGAVVSGCPFLGSDPSIDASVVTGPRQLSPIADALVVSIVPCEDRLLEADVEFDVVIANDEGEELVRGRVRVVDDDQPPVLELLDVELPEGDRWGNFNQILTTPGQLAIRVIEAPERPYDVVVRTDGRGTGSIGVCGFGFDAPGVSRTVTIEPDSGGQLIEPTVNVSCADEVSEPGYWLGIELVDSAAESGASGNGGVFDQARLTIRDDDGPTSEVSVADATVFEGDDGTTQVELAVNVTGGPFPVDVQWFVEALPPTAVVRRATAGNDFVAASGQLAFTPDGGTQTITIDVVGDVLAEGDETFQVRVTSTNGIAPANPARVRIIDDDALQASISDGTSVLEGGTGTATSMLFEVELSAEPTATTFVRWASVWAGGAPIVTVDHLASPFYADEPDFVHNAGSLVFQAGGPRKQTISIEILGDERIEPDERVFVFLEQPTASNQPLIGDEVGVGYIVNDDVPDGIGPVLVGTKNRRVPITSAGALQPVSFEVTALDARDGAVPVDCAPASGSLFALGATTVTCEATDLEGNTTSDSFEVIVESGGSEIEVPGRPSRGSGGTPALRPGESIIARSRGFSPRSIVQVQFRSEPVAVGEVAAGPNGDVAFAFEVPQDATPGRHHVVFIGRDARGFEVEVLLPVVVGQPGQPDQLVPLFTG